MQFQIRVPNLKFKSLSFMKTSTIFPKVLSSNCASFAVAGYPIAILRGFTEKLWLHLSLLSFPCVLHVRNCWSVDFWHDTYAATYQQLLEICGVFKWIRGKTMHALPCRKKGAELPTCLVCFFRVSFSQSSHSVCVRVQSKSTFCPSDGQLKIANI